MLLMLLCFELCWLQTDTFGFQLHRMIEPGLETARVYRVNKGVVNGGIHNFTKRVRAEYHASHGRQIYA